MKLTIGFDELRELVKTRYNKEVSLSRLNDHEVSVSLAQKVIIKTIQIGLDLKVESVSNKSVLVSYGGGMGVDLIIPGVMLFIKAKMPEVESIVASEEGHRIRIYLSNVKQLKPALDKITLRDLTFTDKAVVIDFGLKM